MYLGKCGGGCALAAEGKHSTVPARRGRDRERTVRSRRASAGAREPSEGGRGKVREGERGESANRGAEQLRRTSAAQPAPPSGLPESEPASAQRPRRGRVQEPLYAHTHLHRCQCTLLPPPPPADHCREKNKTPTPSASDKVTEQFDIIFFFSCAFFPCYICFLISAQKERCRIKL